MVEKITTRDLGLAIRDFLESQVISRFEGDETLGHDVLKEIPNAAAIDFIDASDPNNLKVYVDTHQIFEVRIFVQ